MSFNSIVLIVAAVIFVLLLSVFTYFIYESQKRKYNIIPATCPDYWSLSPKSGAKGGMRSQCGGNILWDGVTNNDDYRTSCKPAPTS